MWWWQAIILGFIEGVTEFLPISSTGHMILASRLLNIAESEFVKSFEIIVQMGAILAIFTMYLKKVWEKKEWWGKIAAAFVPTGILGAVLYKMVKTYLLSNELVVVASLILGGIGLILIEKMLANQQDHKQIEELSWGRAGIVGVIQAISMIPGVSRSAATIFGGRVVGMSRGAAVEFSFLLAVPTMAAATGLDLVKMGTSFSQGEVQLLLVGLVVAYVTAWVVVKAFLNYVQHNSLSMFGWYRIVAAVLYLLIVR